MELTVYQYSFVLFGLFSLALGVAMLVCWPVGSFQLDKYRDSKLAFGILFTVISIANCYRMYGSALGNVPQVYADFLSPYVLALVLMLTELFGYSLLALYRSELVKRSNVMLDTFIITLCITTYFILARNEVHNVYSRAEVFGNITMFCMYWRIIMLIVAIALIAKYSIWIERTRRLFRQTIEMFFSEAESYSLPWVRWAFYAAVFVGFLAFLCVITNIQALFVLFVAVILTFMLVFVVSYLTYPVTYFDISSVIEAPEYLKLRIEEENGKTEKIDDKIERWKKRKGYTQFNINVVRMSEDMVCSQMAILNYVKKNTKDNSFYNWIGNMRMLEAKKRMLEENKDGIDLVDLSFEIGYSSYHVFVKEFKQREGIAPKAWLALNAK